jgi:hypothetical protein
MKNLLVLGFVLMVMVALAGGHAWAGTGLAMNDEQTLDCEAVGDGWDCKDDIP